MTAEVPTILTLKLEVEESKGQQATTRHVRHVVVNSAPAMFQIACSESACVEGGHDLTYDVLRHLRAKETLFEGQDECSGRTGSVNCGRILKYVAHATYS